MTTTTAQRLSPADPVVALVAEAISARKEWLEKVEKIDDDCPELEERFYSLEDRISKTTASTPEGIIAQLQYVIKQSGPERECAYYCIEVLERVEAALKAYFLPNSTYRVVAPDNDPIVLLAIQWRRVMRERHDKYNDIVEVSPEEEALYNREYALLDQILKGKPSSVEGVECQVDALKKHFEDAWDKNAELIIKPIEDNAKRFQKACDPASHDYERLEKAREKIFDVRVQNRIEEALFEQQDRWVEAISKRAA